jgi:uncharacterized caspase-like protein
MLSLKTAKADAEDMEEALRRLGFNVIMAVNVDRALLNARINMFSDNIARARGGLALLYYTGETK